MRSDDDTWDITTSVGSTALFVAAARALEAQKPDPVAVDPFAEVFCRAAGGEWAALLDGDAADHTLESEFGADFVNFQGVRTRYFDDYFRAAADAGICQIVLLAAGARVQAGYPRRPPPTAERREVAVDLRDDWQRALREQGFDPAKPSAWVAEGLLIYLPAAAQQQQFTGIDALAAPGSHVAVEEAVPMDAEAFAAKREEERAAGEEGTFFTLVYNEQHEPAARWFGLRGWRAEPTPLPECLRANGRPVPAEDSEAGAMTSTISLVSAVKE